MVGVGDLGVKQERVQRAIRRFHRGDRRRIAGGRNRKARVTYGFDEIALVPGEVTINPLEVDTTFQIPRKDGSAITVVLERAWSETHPLIEVLATGEECGPDGCAI